jgi:hypothetical protein
MPRVPPGGQAIAAGLRWTLRGRSHRIGDSKALRCLRRLDQPNKFEGVHARVAAMLKGYCW